MNSNVSSRRELEALLAEDLPVLEQRQRCTFDQIAGSSGKPLVLFGAGYLGRRILACLRRHGVEPMAFADSNSQKWKTQLDGLEIRAPEEAAKAFGQSAVFVVAIASPGHCYVETRRKLIQLGCACVVPVLPLLWKYATDLLPHYAFETPTYFVQHRDDILAAFDLLRDDLSRRQFIDHLKLRHMAQFEELPRPQLGNQYFPADLFPPRSDEVFVDGGAYDGDTIKALLARSSWRRILAFEPDPGSYARLIEFVQCQPVEVSSRIEAVQAALSSTTGVLRFEASGAPGASASNSGALQVQSLRLDDQRMAESPTFIKLDVEGAERDALLGAQQTITRHRPLVAVCVYHRPDDLWHIPALLHSFYEGYSFHLRWHSYDGWETVLYAVPPGRVLGSRQASDQTNDQSY